MKTKWNINNKIKIKQCVGNAEPFSDMILGVGETWDLFDSSE